VPGQTGLRYFLDAMPAAEHIQRQVAVAIVIAFLMAREGIVDRVEIENENDVRLERKRLAMRAPLASG
jgi:hypothetical protein